MISAIFFRILTFCIRICIGRVNMLSIGKVFRIGTVRYHWPMSAHASQALSKASCTDSEDLPSSAYTHGPPGGQWHRCNSQGNSQVWPLLSGEDTASRPCRLQSRNRPILLDLSFSSFDLNPSTVLTDTVSW